MKHGYYTPSKLDLRYHCPGSAALESALPEEDDATSAAAQAGRDLHDLSRRLRTGELEFGPEIPDAVVFCKQQTDEIIAGLPADVTVIAEYQIDLSCLGIESGSEGCRVDFLAVVPGRFAVVADDKYGAVRVTDPKYNWQMKTYCAGVARAFGVPEVQAVILQPALEEGDRFRSCVFTAEDITETEQCVKSIVEAGKKPGAPLVRGEHCADCFCRARPVCPLWRDAFLSVPQHTPIEKYMLGLAPDRRRDIYENVQAAFKFCEKAIEAIKASAVAGKLDIAGYEVAPGNKRRQWRNDAEAINEMEIVAASKGLSREAVTVPLSPSKAETLLGKKLFDKYIVEIAGEPTLKRKK
jgi:hypothetical protein